MYAFQSKVIEPCMYCSLWTAPGPSREWKRKRDNILDRGIRERLSTLGLMFIQNLPYAYVTKPRVLSSQNSQNPFAVPDPPSLVSRPRRGPFSNRGESDPKESRGNRSPRLLYPWRDRSRVEYRLEALVRAGVAMPSMASTGYGERAL